MALTQHGISLLTLHREAGRRIMRPQGKFDEIVQPYVIDSSRLTQAFDQALFDGAPHPAYPNMFLVNLEQMDEGLSLSRFTATYHGLISGTAKSPKLQVRRAGTITDFEYAGGGLGKIIGVNQSVSQLISLEYVSTTIPSNGLFQQIFTAEDLGGQNDAKNIIISRLFFDIVRTVNFVLSAQDYNQSGLFFEVSEQYTPIGTLEVIPT